jgi:hypothetical protein
MNSYGRATVSGAKGGQANDPGSADPLALSAAASLPLAMLRLAPRPRGKSETL